MANNAIYDQVYKVLESTREILRLEYDHGANLNDAVRLLSFKLNEQGKAVRCEDDEGCSSFVSWRDNNLSLRESAKQVANFLSPSP